MAGGDRANVTTGDLMEAGRECEISVEFTWLDRAESLRLLASVPVGRLIFTVNVQPS
jgi:hypothetical protein